MTNEREVTMVRAPSVIDRRRRSRSVIAGALFGVLAVASGCSSGNPATVGSGTGGNGGNLGPEAGVTCLRDEPGCACQHEGAVIQCGKAAYDDGGEKGTVKCAMGGEICSGGRWSEGETNSNDPALKSSGGLKLITGIQTKALTNPGVSCTNDPCDPYCMQYPDNANGLNGGDAGVTTLGCGDASVLTVVTSGSPDASTAPAGVLNDAALQDGESYIFIDLPPGDTKTLPFQTPAATVKNADIYFLIDDGSSMGAAASNLASALTGTTNGIIQELRALLATGTNFGVGRFEDYYYVPYSAWENPAFEQSSTNPYNMPFQNLLSIQSDTGANYGFTANAVDWLTVDAFLSTTPSAQYFARSGGDIPESSVSALWATATGNGLYAQGSVTTNGQMFITNNSNATNGLAWYTMPRPAWTGSPMAVAGTDTMTSPLGSTFPGPSSEQIGGGAVPCNLTTTISSYPCFRQSSTPVIVMLSDAPAHNGPGGQYSYVETPAATNSPPLKGSNYWPIQPAGGCPAGYGGPVSGAGSMCQLLHDPVTTANVGASFATAIPLPTSGAGTPLPGVYYGVVPNADRPTGDVGGPDWFSGSSVGGGDFVFPPPVAAGAISPWVPGKPQRSSLRDCSATDHVQCTPSMTGGTTYPTVCYNNTSTASSTATVAAVAASNSQYTPTETPIASTPATLYTTPSITEVATTNALVTAGASGGPSALTTIAATTHALTSVAIPTVNVAATPNADSYTSGSVTTLASTSPPYKIPVTTGTYGLPGSITLNPGQELSSVTVTVAQVVTGYTAVVTAAASVGGITTGTATAPTGSSSSTAAGVYYAGASAATVTFSVTQNANSSYSTTYTSSPVEPVNYVEVTLSYVISTPNACPVGMYDEPITYGSAGTSATAECPVCPVGFPYNSGTGTCRGPQCAAGTTIGNGSNMSSTSMCYSCPAGTLNTGTSPWTCSNTCTSGTLGTGGNTGSCYSCSAGTLGNLSSSPPTCSYTCTTGTIGNGTDMTVATSCYSCPNGAALVTTTSPWTCKNTCAGVGYTLGTGVNSSTSTCYTCTGATDPTGNTGLMLDTQSNPWNCASCPGTGSTPPGPAQDTLVTATNPYTCQGCPGAAYTLNTGASTCTPTTLTCANGYSVSGAKCVATSACTNGFAGSTQSAGTPGVGCDGLPVCPTPATSTTQTCYTESVTTAPSAANLAGVCKCAKTTYTAGTSTTATCTTGVATSPNLLAAGNSCSTAGNGNACVVATGAACTGNTGTGGISCQVPPVASAPQCTTDGLPAGDGYYGNDQIFSFQVPAGSGFGSRFYYHFALLRAPAYLASGAAGNAYTGAAPGAGTVGTGTVYANTVAGFTPKPFLYLKSANGFSVNSGAGDIDTSYPFSILSTESATDTGISPILGGPNGPVVDCDISAMVSNGEAANPATSSNTNGSDYVLSEIDGYLPAESTPTTYYLVVDNAGPTSYTASLPTYQYFLQVGGFDDQPTATSVPSYTQPSYQQMITQLNAIQAKFVGVENSGLSCFHPGDAFTQANAQFETRDFMDKVAYDVGSYDSTTTPVRPYVVPVRPDGTACNPTCPAALTAEAAGNACTGACAATCATWGAATCATQYPLSPVYDASTQTCTTTCSTSGDCPMSAPICQAGTPNYCTTGTTCPGGVSGLSCAVASAVSNLTNNLKQNVYLRATSTCGSTYSPPGATCTPTTPGMPGSTQCTGMTTGGTECYGGSCTTTCNVATDCALGSLCEPSTYPGDTNKYCVSPSVFIQSVQAVSTSGAMGSQTVCGIHPGTLPCAIDSQCPPSLPTCLTSGPAMSTCGISDTGPDTVAPLPAYYQAGVPPQDNDGMFNYCSPGSSVTFDVTFTMPFQRSSSAQQYEFELETFDGAGRDGCTRVILENPALSVSDFYRYYDGNTVCPSGSHVVWGNFSYNAICPSDGVGDYSQIRFCATASSSAEAGFVEEPQGTTDGSSGCAPGEVLLGVATANQNPTSMTSLDTVNTCPANGNPGMGYPCAPTNVATATPATWAACTALTTTPSCTANASCSWSPQLGFNVGTILQASAVADDAGLASDQYLRIRMEFDPSVPGDVVAPFLSSWNLDVDCIPSE